MLGAGDDWSRSVGQPAGELYERGAAVGRIEALLAGLEDGRGGALFLLGEGGLGKSSLLALARERAPRGVAVGAGSGSAAEGELPFAPIAEAFEGVCGAAGRELLVPPHEGEGPELTQRTSLFYAALRLLEGLPGAALLSLDDLHVADPDSLALLVFLCRRIGSLPIAVVGALRPWPAAADTAVEALAADGHAGRERLAPLSDAGAHALLAARSGERVSAPSGAEAREFCGGNPLLLEQVAGALRRGERLPQRGDGWPAALGRGLLLARFAGIPEPALQCARAGAVLGVNFPVDVALEVAQLSDDPESDSALAALGRSGLLDRLADGTARFVHPLFREALLEDLPGPLRSRLHGRAFAALARRGRYEAAASHALVGGVGEGPDPVDVLARAARTAAAAGALATAAEWLEAARNLAGDAAPSELLLEQGALLFACGRSEDAVAALQGAVDGARLGPAQRARALAMLGRAVSRTGDYVRATRFYEAAERQGDESVASSARLDRALMAWFWRGPAAAIPIARDAVERSGGDAEALAHAQAVLALLRFLGGEGDGLSASVAAAREARRDPGADLARAEWAPPALLWSHGLLCTFAERFDEGEDVLGAALGAAEEAGAGGALPPLLSTLALLRLRRGRLADSLDLATRAERLADLVPAIRNHCLLVGASAALLAGRVEESEAWCAQAEADVAERGEHFSRLFLLWLRGRRHSRDGRPADALAVFEELERLSREGGVGEPCMVPWARHAIEAHLAAGSLEGARRIVAWLEDAAESLPCRWPGIAAACGRAALADRAGEADRAEAEYGRALELHAETALPLEEAETLLAQGSLRRRRGRTREAREPLRRALQLAEECGATPLAADAASELRLAGGRRRRREDPERLTPAERRVATLAADGKSNREIAAVLTLSVRTVETHLQRVYAKLGLRSRRELRSAEVAGALEDQ